MNNARRRALADLHSQISAAVGMLGDIRAELEMLRDEEQDYHDNMPDSFRDGEKGAAAEDALEAIDDVISEIETFEGSAFDRLLDL